MIEENSHQNKFSLKRFQRQHSWVCRIFFFGEGSSEWLHNKIFQNIQNTKISNNQTERRGRNQSFQFSIEIFLTKGSPLHTFFGYLPKDAHCSPLSSKGSQDGFWIFGAHVSLEIFCNIFGISIFSMLLSSVFGLSTMGYFYWAKGQKVDTWRQVSRLDFLPFYFPPQSWQFRQFYHIALCFDCPKSPLFK